MTKVRLLFMEKDFYILVFCKYKKKVINNIKPIEIRNNVWIGNNASLKKRSFYT